MTKTTRKLVAGNWKMNGSAASLKEAQVVSDTLQAEALKCRVALFPPAPLIHRISEAMQGGPVEVGAQDCRSEASGPFTGDASAEMLHDAGARLVILGHSERRSHHRESNAHIAAKVKGALRGGLEPIICIGEDLDERQSGATSQVLEDQLKGSLPSELEGRPFTVAYEPIWAIGTGKTPTLAELKDAHAFIHKVLADLFPSSGRTSVLYGGSVTPGNAAELLAVDGVDGALVGGASLKAADFLTIIRAAV